MLRKRGAPVFLELVRPRPGAGPAGGPGAAGSPGTVPAGAAGGAGIAGASAAAGPVTPQNPPPMVFLPLRPAPAGPGTATGGAARGGPATGGGVMTVEPKVAVEPAPTIDPRGPASVLAGLGGLATAGAGSDAAFRGVRVWWMLAAGALVAIIIGWVAGYSFGHARGKAEGDEQIRRLTGAAPVDAPGGGSAPAAGSGAARPIGPAGSAGVAGGGTPAGPAPDPLVDPTPPGGGGGSSASSREGTAPPVPAPAPARPGASGLAVGDLRAGYNYLVVATLPRADAEAAGQFLADHGLAAQLMPQRRVDAGSDEAKNGPWLVLVLQGYAPADFSRAASERSALVSQVQRLGRQWKAQNKRAPTDFSQVFWQKQPG